jgi:hypothetical protein
MVSAWYMSSFYFYGSPLARKTRKTNTEVTSVVLLDLRQYYEKSSLKILCTYIVAAPNLAPDTLKCVAFGMAWLNLVVKSKSSEKIVYYPRRHFGHRNRRKILRSDWRPSWRRVTNGRGNQSYKPCVGSDGPLNGCIWCQVGCSYYICAQWSMPDKYFYFYGPPLSRKTRKTNIEGTSVVLLDLRQYYQKSSLAVFSKTFIKTYWFLFRNWKVNKSLNWFHS